MFCVVMKLSTCHGLHPRWLFWTNNCVHLLLTNYADKCWFGKVCKSWKAATGIWTIWSWAAVVSLDPLVFRRPNMIAILRGDKWYTPSYTSQWASLVSLRHKHKKLQPRFKRMRFHFYALPHARRLPIRERHHDHNLLSYYIVLSISSTLINFDISYNRILFS